MGERDKEDGREQERCAAIVGQDAEAVDLLSDDDADVVTTAGPCCECVV